MESDPLIWQIILQIILIALNAVFACAEIAVITMNDAKLTKLAAEGDKRAMRLARLTSQPAKFLATIQVAITLAGFLGSAFAADNFANRITHALVSSGVGISASTINTISVIVITLILSYFTLVFGELVPKRIAMKKAEQLALGMSGLISFISKIFAPLVWLLTISTNAMLRLFGIDPQANEEAYTEEDIRMMIDVGSEKGAIDREEKQMLQNVFEFDDISAGEIATHRTQVDLLWMDDGQSVWEETIHSTRHSRYPVCEDNVDNVIGILDAKDYFRLSDRTRDVVMQQAVSAPYFVPESVKADVLFNDMKKNRNHFAVVLDEYGGFEGIVTMSDLLEEIVGDFAEEDDEPQCYLERLDDNTWCMSGSVPLDVVTDELHVELPTDEFDTLGGLVFSTQNAVPEDGTQFACVICGLHIRITEIKNHRIERALVRPVGCDAKEAE